MRHHRIACSVLSLAFAAAFSGQARAGSETPPAGAPWQRNFAAAQREALKTGKPIFVYFTKTY